MEVSTQPDKEELGRMAAADGVAQIRRALEQSGSASIILATGASQFEMLRHLVAADVDWSRVDCFHLDEYVGIGDSHPASFRRYLRERFVDLLERKPRSFEFIRGDADTPTECERLSALIAHCSIDVAFIGIGENGHLAFNDPPADFETDTPYLMVELDEECRRQQLGEGWFPDLESVPKFAISMSIRQILRSQHIICSVPDARKAKAVKQSIQGEITNRCPASILQRHTSATIYLDPESSSQLD